MALNSSNAAAASRPPPTATEAAFWSAANCPASYASACSADNDLPPLHTALGSTVPSCRPIANAAEPLTPGSPGFGAPPPRTTSTRSERGGGDRASGLVKTVAASGSTPSATGYRLCDSPRGGGVRLGSVHRRRLLRRIDRRRGLPRSALPLRQRPPTPTRLRIRRAPQPLEPC